MSKIVKLGDWHLVFKMVCPKTNLEFSNDIYEDTKLVFCQHCQQYHKVSKEVYEKNIKLNAQLNK